MREFIENFTVNELLLAKLEKRNISLRPVQATLGSLKLSLDSECSNLSVLTPKEEEDFSSAFIDVFPLIKGSSERKNREQDWLGFRRTVNKLLKLLKSKEENFRWFLNAMLAFKLELHFMKLSVHLKKGRSFLKCRKMLTNYMTAYAYYKSEFVGNYESQFRVKAFWPKEWFLDYIMKDFEGVNFWAPLGYDKLLTQVYDICMKFTLEEQRVSGHHEAYLNLDKRIGDMEVLSSLKK